jgi:hypothetical protein
MQFHRLFEYPQLIPFTLYFCSKRCRVTRVSFLLLPSQFILEDWHIKQPGGRCIGPWASAIEFNKTHRHGKTLPIVPKIYGLVYLHGSELTVDFLFRLFVTRLKRTRRPGPNERSVHYVSCARLLETLDDAFYPPLFISFNSYNTEF